VDLGFLLGGEEGQVGEGVVGGGGRLLAAAGGGSSDHTLDDT
jgi:hypothetical protein